MLKTATFKLILEFPPHVLRQHPALGGPMRFESRIVFLDKLIKESQLRAMALVTKRTLAQTGFPASRQLQHNRVLAIRCLAEVIRRHPLLHYSASVMADFEEKCVEESCDTEESEELHESYESECFEESCDVEEVREIAGRRGNINAMLNDFQSRGFAVNMYHSMGACVASPGNNTNSFDAFFDTLCSQA